jgi:uncharacterized membrane protein (UPF0182 family)
VAQAPPVAPRESTVDPAQPTSAEQGREPALVAEASTLRFVPYYTMFNTGERREFVLLRPFVPFSSDDARRELQAFMTASSDPETYGTLTVHVVEPGDGGLPAGPLSIANTMESDPLISREITVQNQQRGGSRVRFGDLQLVNLADGLLWVRPFYVGSEQDSSAVSSVFEYAFVMVAYDDEAAYAPTLGEALAQLFPGLDIDIGERSDTATDPVAELDESPQQVPPDGTPPADVPATGAEEETTDAGSEGDSSRTPSELLAEADTLLREAEERLLADADLGAYQERVNQAGALVGEALELLGPVETVSTAPPADEVMESTDTTG